MFSTTFPKSFPTRENSIRIPIRHDVCARSTAASGSAKQLYNDADLIPYESNQLIPRTRKAGRYLTARSRIRAMRFTACSKYAGSSSIPR
jgi:hypothetical protein